MREVWTGKHTGERYAVDCDTTGRPEAYSLPLHPSDNADDADCCFTWMAGEFGSDGDWEKVTSYLPNFGGAFLHDGFPIRYSFDKSGGFVVRAGLVRVYAYYSSPHADTAAKSVEHARKTAVEMLANTEWRVS